jgi:hypothetical protein
MATLGVGNPNPKSSTNARISLPEALFRLLVVSNSDELHKSIFQTDSSTGSKIH